MSGVEARSGPVWADRVRERVGRCGTGGTRVERPRREEAREQAGLSRRERRWRRIGLRRASGLQARREREGKLGPRGVWVGFPGQFGLSLAGLGFSFFSLLIQTKLKLILFEFKFEFEFKTLALKQSENHAPA